MVIDLLANIYQVQGINLANVSLLDAECIVAILVQALSRCMAIFRFMCTGSVQ